jgi:hypothetical protein
MVLIALMISVPMHAQQTQACAYIVKQVSFEHPSGLTPQQLAKLRTVVIGRCYDPDNASYVSQYVFDQLRAWGFQQATVYDPARFQVLDKNLHPSPISIAIDFRLRGSDMATDQRSLHR